MYLYRVHSTIYIQRAHHNTVKPAGSSGAPLNLANLLFITKSLKFNGPPKFFYLRQTISTLVCVQVIVYVCALHIKICASNTSIKP